MLRPWSPHPCFLKQIRRLCDIIIIYLLYLVAEKSDTHRIATSSCTPSTTASGRLVRVVLCSSQRPCKQQSVRVSHLHSYIVFFQYASTWSRFPLLEVWTVFKSLIHFPYQLSDCLLLLPVAAITFVLCIIKIFPIWVVCHGYRKSAVCNIPESRKGRYIYSNWINTAFSLKGTSTLTETTLNGDC